MPDTPAVESKPAHTKNLRDGTKHKDHKKSHRRRSGGRNSALNLVLLVIAVVAVRRQLRLPKAERTWHGTVDVPVPYDFRRPTKERVKLAFWDPSNDHLFTPHAFGVGWSLNAARLLGRHQPSKAGNLSP